jgi:hypothetical protein
MIATAERTFGESTMKVACYMHNTEAYHPALRANAHPDEWRSLGLEPGLARWMIHAPRTKLSLIPGGTIQRVFMTTNVPALALSGIKRGVTTLAKVVEGGTNRQVMFALPTTYLKFRPFSGEVIADITRLEEKLYEIAFELAIEVDFIFGKRFYKPEPKPKEEPTPSPEPIEPATKKEQKLVTMKEVRSMLLRSYRKTGSKDLVDMMTQQAVDLVDYFNITHLED